MKFRKPRKEGKKERKNGREVSRKEGKKARKKERKNGREVSRKEAKEAKEGRKGGRKEGKENHKVFSYLETNRRKGLLGFSIAQE